MLCHSIPSYWTRSAFDKIKDRFGLKRICSVVVCLSAALWNYPRPFFLIILSFLWIGAQCGAFLRRRKPLKQDRDDFTVVEGATLTLLGLIIGFSFSMAITRFDQRINYEEEEANAIGTEYLRLGLLPAEFTSPARADLRKYLDERIAFYRTQEEPELQRIDARTAELQSRLWRSVEAAAHAQPSVITSLAVSGMNDVLNSQGYTQASWLNRIPASAWVFMLVIGFACNVLVGYGTRSASLNTGLLFVLPLIVSTSFLLIADIDSPRRGFISVPGRNLMSLAQSLHD
jgi:hypothetical protein